MVRSMNGIYPLLAVLCWSGNIIVTRLSAGQIEPGAMAFYRWLAASVVMTPFLLKALLKNRDQVRRELPRLAGLGFLGMVAYQGLAYLAAQTLTATTMAVINSFIPIMTLGLSIFFLKEKPTLRFLLGGLISIGGLFYLLGQGDPKLFFKQGLTVGVGLLLIASFAYALYGVFLKRWPTRLTRWQSLYVQAVCGTIMLLPVFLLSTPGPIQLSHLPLILYAGVIASVFAPFLWMMGVEKLGPSLASIFMNLLPVATSVIAVLFLHEELHGYHFIGGGFTLLGVLLAQLDGRR